MHEKKDAEVAATSGACESKESLAGVCNSHPLVLRTQIYEHTGCHAKSRKAIYK